MKTTEKRGYKYLEPTDRPDLTLYGESLKQVDADVNELFMQNNDFAQLKSRSATVVVAANNSRNKKAADFVVPDGAKNAQEIINTALNACPVGGRVILLEGTYYCNKPFRVVSQKIIEGQGTGTILKVSDDFDNSSGDWLVSTDDGHIGTYKNIMLDGSDLGNVSGIRINHATIKVYNVVIKDFGGCGILTSSEFLSIEVNGCTIMNNGMHGIILKCGYNTIEKKIIAFNYLIGNGKKTNNSYSNIELQGISNAYTSYVPNDLFITNNLIRSNNVSKYGINFGLVRGIILGNNLSGAGLTGNLSAQYQSGCIVDHNII